MTRSPVQRVDRDLLEVTVPDGRVVRTGCESYEGVLTVWLDPGLRFGDGTPVTAGQWAWIEREVAGYAAAAGLTLAVHR